MIRPSLYTCQGPFRKVALVGSSLLLAAAAPLAAQSAPASAVPVSAKADPAAVRGAMLAISPLRVELDGPGAAQTLRLSNTGGSGVIVQTRVFAWSQNGGADQYSPSNAVIASPAVATIPPGQTQIIRLFRTAAVGNDEKAFRVSIDQIPDAKLPETSAAATRLRFLVPMFVDRARATPSKLVWQQGPAGLILANQGGRTARIAWIKPLDAAGQPIPLEGNSLRYVQGGNSTVWAMPNLCRRGVTHLLADIDEVQVDVPLSPCS